MPEDWRNSVITPIYKEKGDIQDCGNYQGIKLMSHTMKSGKRSLMDGSEMKHPLEQNNLVFMLGRSTMDAVFSLRVIMEKYREGPD